MNFLLKINNQSACKTMKVQNANISNENKNKTRHDHDDTQAGYSNIQLALTIITWFARGDYVPTGHQTNIFDCTERRENYMI